MTFYEWFEGKVMSEGYTTKTLAMAAWDTAYEAGFDAGYEEHFNDSEKLIADINLLAYNLYIALGTVCHNYQVQVSDKDQEMIKKVLKNYREYKGY